MKKIIIIITTLFIVVTFNVINEQNVYGVVDDNNLYFDYESNLDSTYYSSLMGLSGDAFRAELNDIITEGFVWRTYNTSDRYTILPEADAVYGQPGKVYCVYSGQIFNADDCTANGTVGYLWNTEHVWAKSHGFPSTSQVPYSDYHHLRVACKNTNSRINNRFIGSVEGLSYSTDEWGNKYTSDTWEPLDYVKGDVARMLLYMDVRYDGEASNDVDLILLDDYSFPDSASDPYMGHLSTLLQWHEDDPVDDRERYRNDVIYSYQNNRNPFIDCPEYVNMIWGEGIDTEVNLIEQFDNFVSNINPNITINSQQEIALAYVLYNKMSEFQKEQVTMFSTLEQYYKTYLDIGGYTEEELDIIFEFYDDYDFLKDILNGNFSNLESYF